jgi:hypothetical protein
MSWRLFAIGLILFGAVVLNGFGLWNEEIAPPDAATKAEERRKDELFGMQFVPSDREANFLKMGFSPEETGNILARVKTLEEKYRVKEADFNQIVVRIEATEEEDELAAAFCGTGSTLPVRYAAMPFLIEERNGQLKAVDVDEISAFTYGKWAASARIQAAYEEGDRTEDRKEDAVRMVMAAVLAKDEGTLIEHGAPWGGGFIGGGWSWKNVMKKHPGVQQRLVEYAALMHIVLENARAENGLCAS